jgi:ribosomal protein L37AE/L43A
MAGISWSYLIPIISLIALGAVLVSVRRRRSANERKPDHCSSCATPMSLRRVSTYKSHVMPGAWMCPHCGARTDKWGRNVSRTA